MKIGTFTKDGTTYIGRIFGSEWRGTSVTLTEVPEKKGNGPDYVAFAHDDDRGAFGRAKGRSIVAAAAYRAGIRIEDERTGQTADYRARSGVEETFVLARGDDATARAQDIGRLWNEGERAEPRANGRIATEIVLGLPHELDAPTRKQLLKDYLAPIIEQHGVAAQVSIHAPDKEGDHRNWHAHVLITQREYGRDGFGERSNPRTVQWKGRKPETIYGIAANPADIVALRQQWEQHVNRAYEREGLDIRVDHRSHKDRGIEQEPTKHLGPVATAMEREEPGSSDRGDINRDIEARNAALAERAQLEIEAVKAAADLAAARMMAAREAEAEQRKAAIGRYDDLRPDRERQSDDRPQPDYAAAKGRVDDVRPDRRAEYFDRDAADAAWNDAVAAAGIKAAEREAYDAARGRRDEIRPSTETAREASQTQEATAAPSAPEATNTSATEPPRAAAAEIRQTVHDAERATSDSFADAAQTVEKSVSVAGRFLAAIADKAASIISGIGDMLFPTAPPTREEAQGRQRAAEERERTIEGVRSQAEREAARQELLRQMARDDAIRRQERYNSGRGDDDDYGGRERDM